MNLNAAAATHTTSPELIEPVDRALFIGRRAIGWLVDGFLLAAVLTTAWILLSFVAMLAVGATVGAAGGGIGSIAVGGAASVAALGLLIVGMHLIAGALLLAYYRWAARRVGANAGQTLGHQLAGVRVVNAADASVHVRGRALLGRELARYLWMFLIAFPALTATLMTNSTALGNLILFAGIAVVIWRSAPDRFPHDRLVGTRVVDVSATAAR